MIATSSSAKTTTTAAAAGALGSKSARACDGCLRRRARWYCAADDAFLCQGCDTSVHSANPLARRHERLRLQPSSSSSPLLRSPPSPAVGGGGANNNSKRERRAAAAAAADEVVPAWFRRKARTPRGGGHNAANKSAVGVGRELSRRLVVVPEPSSSSAGGGNSPDDGQSFVGGREVETEEAEEQLLYRVPVFDPALAEFCSPPPPLEDAVAAACGKEDGDAVVNPPSKHDAPPTQFFPDGGHVASFEPTDAELREFAADMEALLGRGLDDGNEEDSSFYMETLGLLDHPMSSDDGGARVKVEAENGGNVSFDAPAACHHLELDEPEASDEMLDIDFDYGSPQEETPADDDKAASSGGAHDKLLQRSLSLTLNYEAIIQSWGSSPWTGGGDRPHVKLDDCWPQDYTGMSWAVGGVVGHGGEELITLPRLGMDGGREARVSRYREKRRTRLFSKKIRYEVRKLNAEKRPRMKGRFVKRATAGGVAIAGLA